MNTETIVDLFEPQTNVFILSNFLYLVCKRYLLLYKHIFQESVLI